MLKRLTTTLSICMIVLLIQGCALKRPYTNAEIKGTWECVKMVYGYLDIRDNDTGFLVFGLGDIDPEIYKIISISYPVGEFILHVENVGENDEPLNKIYGKAYGDLIILNFLKNQKKNATDEWYFTKESKISESRELIKNTIKKLELNQ